MGDAERYARLFHDTYERLAPEHGWETQERSRVGWDDLPPENRALMVAVVVGVVGPLTAERDALTEQLQAALALGTIAAAERDEARARVAAAEAEAERLREQNAGLIGRNVQALTALRRACADGWSDGDGAMSSYLVDAAVNPDPRMPEHGDYTPVTPPTDQGEDAS